MVDPEKTSKKQSDGKTSARQRQRESCVFYLDENLSECKAIHQVLDTEQIKYERHYHHFSRTEYPNGVPDPLWLDFVGAKRWIVLTKDKAQRYNALEKAQLERHKIKQFAFQSGNLSGEEMATLLKLNLGKMFRLLFNKQRSHFVATLSDRGIILHRYSRKGSN